MIERYMPSNGTEGDGFFVDWCSKCARDRSMRDGVQVEDCDEHELCDIIAPAPPSRRSSRRKQMARADYRLCDVCDGKAFYDANLNYDGAMRINGEWVYPEKPYRVAGEPQQYGYSLDYVGDWAVICSDCAKTHKTIVVQIEQERSDG